MKTAVALLVGGALVFIFVAGRSSDQSSTVAATGAELDVEAESTDSEGTKETADPWVAARADPGEPAGSSRTVPADVRQQARAMAGADLFAGLSPAEAATMVQERFGNATVVVIYPVTCPRSRGLLLQMEQASGEGWLPDVLPFSYRNGSDLAPPTGYALRDWAPGELDRAMAGVGIHVGAVFTQPLVALIDSEGRVVEQWRGLGSIEPLRQAVTRLG